MAVLSYGSASSGVSASNITSGVLGIARMPRSAAGLALLGAGAGVPPVYALNPGDPLAAGANIMAAANTARNFINGAPTLKKVLVVGKSGQVTIDFDLEMTVGAPNPVHGRIYLNGIARGTDQSTNSVAYVTFSENLDVVAGDTVELWAWAPGPGSGDIRNFRMKSSRATDTVYGRQEVD